MCITWAGRRNGALIRKDFSSQERYYFAYVHRCNTWAGRRDGALIRQDIPYQERYHCAYVLKICITYVGSKGWAIDEL